MSNTVEQIVEELADKGARGFRASYVARRAGVDPAVAVDELFRLVGEKKLDPNFELLCPETGQTLIEYSNPDEIPDTFKDDRCEGGEEFEVDRELVWVSFIPSREYYLGLHAQKKRPQARFSRLIHQSIHFQPLNSRPSFRRSTT